MRKEIFPAISVNKHVTFTSSCSPTTHGEPWRNSGKKEYLPSSSHPTVAMLYGELWGSLACQKHRKLAPDIWGANQRNGFSYHRLLLLPIQRASQMVPVVKNLPANVGGIWDAGSIPGLGRSSREGHDNPLQYSCLENPMDRAAWQDTVHRVTMSQTQLKQLSTYIENCQIP